MSESKERLTRRVAALEAKHDQQLAEKAVSDLPDDPFIRTARRLRVRGGRAAKTADVLHIVWGLIKAGATIAAVVGIFLAIHSANVNTDRWQATVDAEAARWEQGAAELAAIANLPTIEIGLGIGVPTTREEQTLVVITNSGRLQVDIIGAEIRIFDGFFTDIWGCGEFPLRLEPGASGVVAFPGLHIISEIMVITATGDRLFLPVATADYETTRLLMFAYSVDEDTLRACEEFLFWPGRPRFPVSPRND
ncbi:MAG: hypothetical protein FWD83_00340 [Promicromonosporaceae bacterium]|nr:hypothetical protein [Promicromonosporaceae bacterium]